MEDCPKILDWGFFAHYNKATNTLFEVYMEASTLLDLLLNTHIFDCEENSEKANDNFSKSVLEARKNLEKSSVRKN